MSREPAARGGPRQVLPAESLPRMSVFATSAVTHIPGAMTMRGRGYVLGGHVLAGLIAFGIFWIDLELERRRLQAHWSQQQTQWERDVRDDVADTAPRLADPVFTTIPVCGARPSGRSTVDLLGARRG